MNKIVNEFKVLTLLYFCFTHDYVVTYCYQYIYQCVVRTTTSFITAFRRKLKLILIMEENCEEVHLDITIDVNDIEKGAREIIKQVRSSWPLDQLQFKYFNHGITNQLVGVWYPDHYNHMVLIRIYGHKTDLFLNRKDEKKAVKILHKAGLTHSIYATFNNGFAYEFLEGEILSIETVRRPEIYKLVAKRMAEMHLIEPNHHEISKEPIIWNKSEKFMELMPKKFSNPSKQLRFTKLIKPYAILEKEYQFLKERLSNLNNPIVYAHNDLLLANIIYNQKDNSVTFIDYEYTGYNYQAFDIANHFIEFAGIESPDYSLYPEESLQKAWLKIYLQSYNKVNNVLESEINQLYDQVNKFVPLTHFFWGCWALIQSQNSYIDYDFLGTNTFVFQELATIKDLEVITKEQQGLVEIRNVGTWIIHRCLNCSIYTHAVHKEYGAALVLININMITSSEEIEQLKSNIDYSNVFKIVIDRSTFDDLDYLQPPNKFSVSQLLSATQVALGCLHQQLEEAVQRQATDVEEKIRNFTAEQYQLLEQFREKAHNEYRLLTSLLLNGEELKRLTDNTGIPQQTSDDIKGNITTSRTNEKNIKSHRTTNDAAYVIQTNIKCEPTIMSSNVHINNSIEKKDVYAKEPNSFDTEALFPLEGMEDTSTDYLRSSEEESDTDDSGQDEGIHMHRGQRGGHPTLAKSLPVNVPTFPAFIRKAIPDQGDDQLSRDPLDPHNIRASIKALAKSVHGDTVFGDLPRPRFSTQI
ncbi:ethanolamine kinase 1 isoform X1 [Vespula squamosa]|uniref:ethanolamine kinase n=1 Tax=Vespula squamosa TaxID=30214 RepID=A0ABD2B119_VESSQ